MKQNKKTKILVRTLGKVDFQKTSWRSILFSVLFFAPCLILGQFSFQGRTNN